jgi:type VI secretion system secreted protein Hcp
MAIYMKYDGMKGDVTEAGHESWIKLNSISFSAHRDADTGIGQANQRQGGNVAISDITVTKPICAASPQIFTASVVGLGKKVEIHITRTGESDPTNYIELVLENCCITNYGVSSNGASHLETISLNFLKLELNHKGVKDDGSPGSPKKVSFNIPEGAAA